MESVSMNYPKEWESKSLFECCTKITDGTHDTPKVTDSGRPFYTAIHVRENGIDYENCLYLSEADHRIIYQRCNPERDDILLVNIGAGVCTTTLVEVDYEFSIKNVALLKPNKSKVDSRFIDQVIKFYRPSIVTSITNGGAQPFLGLGQIGNLIFTIPTKKQEQEAIANALSDADAYIESLEKLIAKKTLNKKGVMQELLTGKRRLEGFKDKWTSKSFRELFQFGGGYSASRDDLSNEGNPYLHYGDIHTSSKTYIDLPKEAHIIPKLNIPLSEASSSSVLQHGDVVFVDASEDDEGTSKHVVIYNPENSPFISGLHTIVAKSRTDEIDINFRRFCFQTDEVKKQFKFYAVGTKVSGVSKTNIAKINLTFPRKEEQKAIANFLIDIESEQEVLSLRLQKARLLKQGMMQELLIGRIRLV